MGFHGNIDERGTERKRERERETMETAEVWSRNSFLLPVRIKSLL